MGEELSVRLESPQSSAGRPILRAYLAEVVGRFPGRTLRAHELEAAVSDFPSDDLIPPHGVLFVAWLKDQPIGCAGLRLLDDDTGTRHDLAEARALHAAIGFREVTAFNDEPYAQH